MKDERYFFEKEKLANLQIAPNTKRQVRMVSSVAQNQVSAPLIINNRSHLGYSYIVVPFRKNGTLLDLLINANEKHIKLSKSLQNYLWLQCVICVYDLDARSKLSHLDLKPENFVFDDNFLLQLIDFGQASKFNEL
jgi:serine/threonine protein kinase